MKNLVVLFSDSKLEYSDKELFRNTSCKEFVLQWAFSVKDFAFLSIYVSSEKDKKTFLDLIEKIDCHKKKSVNIIVKDEWKVADLMNQIKIDSANFDNIVLGWADSPFYNTELTNKLLDLHTESMAEYCFADGYPAGLGPEILHPGTVNILDSLCNLENSSDNSVLKSVIVGKQPVKKDSIFELIKTDINSFEIETVLSDEDFRENRFEFYCNSKNNFTLCKNFAKLFFEDKTYFYDYDIEKICSESQNNVELLQVLPTFYNIQIASKCKSTCSYCPYPKCYSQKYSVLPCESSDFMSYENFSTLIDKIAEFSGEAVISLSLWGESTLHPQLDLFIEKILSYSGLSVLIELSELNLSDEKLNKISQIVKNSEARTNGKEKIYWIVSVDAANQEVYEKIHGKNSSFEQVCSAVLKLSSLFENCVYPQFIRLKENEESLETFYRFWKEKNDEKLIIQKYDWFAGFLEDKKTADLTPITRNPCWHLRRDFVILLNGDVTICREELLNSSQGNVFSESLENIWQKRKAFLEDFVKGNYNQLCEKCDEYYTFNF